MLIGARRPVDLVSEKTALTPTARAPPDVLALGHSLERRLPAYNITLEQAQALVLGQSVEGLPELYTRHGLAEDALREIALWINPHDVLAKPPGEWSGGLLKVPGWARRLWAEAVANPTSPLWEMLYINEMTRGFGARPPSFRLSGMAAREAWQKYVEWRDVYVVDAAGYTGTGNVLHNAELVRPGAYADETDLILVVEDCRYIDENTAVPPRVSFFDPSGHLAEHNVQFPLRLFVVRSPGLLGDADPRNHEWLFEVNSSLEVIEVPRNGYGNFQDAPAAIQVVWPRDCDSIWHVGVTVTMSSKLLGTLWPELPAIRLGLAAERFALETQDNWQGAELRGGVSYARHIAWKTQDKPIHEFGADALFYEPATGEEAIQFASPPPARTVFFHLLMHYDMDRGVMEIVMPSDARPSMVSPTGLRHPTSFSSALCFLSSEQIQREDAPAFYDGACSSLNDVGKYPLNPLPVYDVKEPPETTGKFALLRRNRGKVDTPTTFASPNGFVWPRQHWNITRMGGFGDAPVWFGLYAQEIDPKRGVSGEIQLVILDVQDKLAENNMEVFSMTLLSEWTLQGRRYAGPSHEYHFKLSYTDAGGVAAQLVASPAYQAPTCWRWK